MEGVRQCKLHIFGESDSIGRSSSDTMTAGCQRGTSTAAGHGSDGFKDEKQRDKEWVTCEMAKREWATKRLGKSRARADDRIGRGVADEMTR